jgi:peptidoglycan/LPS O-acetylase OafA/YrhL
MLLKRIAAIFFAIAFLMAIVLFTGTGREYISLPLARILFLIFGASALLLNLLSFRFGKHDPGFNLVYWLGSLILFVGLVFMIRKWPYGYYLLLAGLFTVGVSFFVPAGLVDKKNNKEDILDDRS